MAKNSDLSIEIISKLNVGKSVKAIDASLKGIEKLIKAVKLKATIDDKQIKKLAKEIEAKLKIQPKFDASNTRKLKKEIDNIQKQIKTKTLVKGSQFINLTVERQAFDEISKRIRDIRKNVDKLAKVDISTNKKGQMTSATLTYYNKELGKTVKETMGWTTVQQKLNGELVKTKTFETQGFKYSDNLEKANKEAEKLVKNASRVRNALGNQKKNIEVRDFNYGELSAIPLSVGTSRGIFKDYIKTEYGESAEIVNDFRDKMLKTGEVISQSNFRVKEGKDKWRNYGVTINKASGEVRLMDKGLKDVINRQMSFGTATKIAITRIGQWGIATGLVYGSLNQLRNGIGIISDIDKEMTSLKKVTDETANTYKNFIIEARDLGNVLGKQTSEVIRSTSEFARLGYTLQQSKKLAQEALLYSNVGDIDVETASTDLISTIKGFGITVDEEGKNVRKIVDIYNEVGNRFAISSAGIGSALKRSSASLFEAGNTIEQAVAMVTAANTVIQDPEVVGTALKTVSMRLRGISEDGEDIVDLIPTLESSFQSIGLTLKEDNETFKSTYEIMNDLSTVWNTLSDFQRANITELVAGKRQGNVVASMLNNWQDAQDALKTGLESFGSAAKEQEKYMDSIEYKVNRFKNTLSGFWSESISTEGIKSFVDNGTYLVEVLTKIVEQFGFLNTIVALAGVGFVGFTKSGEQFRKTIMQFIPALGAYNAKIVASTQLTKVLGITFDVAKVKAIAFQAVLSLGLTVIITGLVTLLDKLIGKFQEYNEKQKEINEQNQKAVEAWAAHRQEIEKLVAIYEKLSKIPKDQLSAEQLKELADVQNQLNTLMPTFTEYVDEQGNAHLLTTEAIKRQIEATKKLKEIDDQQKVIDFDKNIEDKIKKLDQVQNKINNIGKHYSNLDDPRWMSKDERDSFELQNARDKIQLDQEYNSVLDETISLIKERADIELKNANITDKVTDSQKEQLDTLINQNKETLTSKDAVNARIVAILNLIKSFSEQTQETKDSNVATVEAIDYTERYNQALSDLQSTLSNSAKNIASVDSLLQEFKETGKMNMDTVIGLAETYPQLLSVLGDEGAIRKELIKIIESEQNVAKEAYVSMLQYDENFYKTKVLNNNDLVEELQKKYNIDLNNYKTLAEAKLKIDSALIKQLAGQWADYFDATGNIVGKVIDGGRTLVSPDGKETYITKEMRTNLMKYYAEKDRIDKALRDIASNNVKINFDELGIGNRIQKDLKDTKKDTDKLGDAFDVLQYKIDLLAMAYDKLNSRKELMAKHDKSRLNILTDEIKVIEEQIKLKKEQIKQLETEAKTPASKATAETVKITNSTFNVDSSNPFGSGFTQSNPYGKKNARYSSGYHTGVDYSAPEGTPIKSVTSGTVISAKNMGSYGNAVVVQDENGKYHLYGHMSSIDVKSGAKINAGTKLGGVGSTGNSTGNHLHYEVRNANKYGSDVNPNSYLKGLNGTTTTSTTVSLNGTVVNDKDQANAIQELLAANEELDRLIGQRNASYAEYRETRIAIVEREVELIDQQIQMEQTKNQVNEEGSAAYNASIERQLDLYQQKKDALHEEANVIRDIISNLEKMTKLDGIDRSEEISRWNDELQQVKLSFEEIQATIVDMRRNAADKTIDAIKDVFEQQIDAIDKEIEAEEKRHDKKIENIEKERDAFNKAVDDQIESLRKLRDEEDFEKELKGRQDEAQSLRDQISRAMLDTSPAGKARLAELQKELTDVLADIAEMQADREYDLRVENLEDIKNANDEKVDDAIETAEEELEAIKEGFEEQKQALQDVLNDQKRWSELSQAIAQGHYDKVADMFEEFADIMGDNSEGLGKRLQRDLIDKLKDAEAILDDLTGGEYEDSKKDNPKTSNVNGYIISNDGKYIEVKDGKLTGGDGKQYTIDKSGNMYDTKGEWVKQTPLYDRFDLNGYIFGDNGQKIVVTNGILTGGDGKQYFIDEFGNMYDKNGKKIKKVDFTSFHTGGIVGGKSSSRQAYIINSLFNANPNEEIIKALEGEIMVPPANITRNFIPNMQKLVNSIPRIAIKDQTRTGDINYYLNLRIDNVTGDKAGANLIYNELVSGLKKLGKM